MKNTLRKINYVLSGEDGASNVEIVIWISVVLVIATILFAFRDSIGNFLKKATSSVNNLKVN